MQTTDSQVLFVDYYHSWVSIYKKDAVRSITLQKYELTEMWLRKLIPTLKVGDMSRVVYQEIINGYAREHERQTTMDFHHQVKAAVMDAIDEGLIDGDPTRKVIIKGKQTKKKKAKYLNKYELQRLLSDLCLENKISWDWLILLVAKTGLRFSEALALTPGDFNFAKQTLNIDKTWDYKSGTGFLPTKNKSSVRKIPLDWQTVIQFWELVRDKEADNPIFIQTGQKVYNSTINGILERHCQSAGTTTITIHGLRHTHASLLLFDGVSIGSVAQRLGHSSMTTTQRVYLHIIRELENQDTDLIMRSLSSLIN